MNRRNFIKKSTTSAAVIAVAPDVIVEAATVVSKAPSPANMWSEYVLEMAIQGSIEEGTAAFTDCYYWPKDKPELRKKMAGKTFEVR